MVRKKGGFDVDQSSIFLLGPQNVWMGGLDGAGHMNPGFCRRDLPDPSPP